MRLVRYTYPTYRSIAPVAATRSPWAGLESEIDRLFQTALSDFAAPDAADRFPVDVYEDKEATYVRAELPGVARDGINVEVVDGTLNLSASRTTKDGDREESVRFNRSLDLGETVDTTKITAAYENGVLTVTLPKKEVAKPRSINVAVN